MSALAQQVSVHKDVATFRLVQFESQLQQFETKRGTFAQGSLAQEMLLCSVDCYLFLFQRLMCCLQEFYKQKDSRYFTCLLMYFCYIRL